MYPSPLLYDTDYMCQLILSEQKLTSVCNTKLHRFMQLLMHIYYFCAIAGRFKIEKNGLIGAKVWNTFRRYYKVLTLAKTFRMANCLSILALEIFTTVPCRNLLVQKYFQISLHPCMFEISLKIFNNTQV